MEKIKKYRFEYYWRAIFEFAVFIKGFNGIWETLSGFLVLFFSKAAFGNLFFFLARNELLEDPHDSFIAFMAQALQNLSASAKTFAAIYILLHGLLNIFLAIQLYRNKLWAYLVTINVMVIFIFYQVYRIILHHSVMLSILTVFDAIFIILTWHEYQYQKTCVIKSPIV